MSLPPTPANLLQIMGKGVLPEEQSALRMEESVDASEIPQTEPTASASVRRARFTKCIFCSKTEEQIAHSKFIYPPPQYTVRLKSMADLVDDQDLIERINHLIRVAYHEICMLNFQEKYRSRLLIPNVNTEKEIKRIHHLTFQVLIVYYNESINSLEQTYFLKDLFQLYKAIFSITAKGSPSVTINNLQNYTSQDFKKKILSEYSDKIYISLHYSGEELVLKTGMDLPVFGLFEVKQKVKNIYLEDTLFSY